MRLLGDLAAALPPLRLTTVCSGRVERMGAFGGLYGAGVLIHVPNETRNSRTVASPKVKQERWNHSCCLILRPKVFITWVTIASWMGVPSTEVRTQVTKREDSSQQLIKALRAV